MKAKLLLISLYVLSVFLVSAQAAEQDKGKKFPAAGSYASTKLTYSIIPAPGHTYCYDIYSDNKLIIHQPSVPGIAGTEGFKTKDGAENVARLVIKKIDKGEMPPTVTVEEMKKLKALP